MKPSHTAPSPPGTALRDTLRALCRRIEAEVARAPEERRLDLAALARAADLSPWHLQRRFKALVGVSPRQYAEACRLRLLRAGLRGAPSVTDAIHAAGYGSGSRVYERTATRLGMTPGEYRRGGQGLDIAWAMARTAHGLLLMAATDRGLCSVQLGATRTTLLEGLRAEFPAARIAARPCPAGAALAGWLAALRAHLAGHAPAPELPLDIRGTALQMQVWQFLAAIPAGEVRTYAEVAQALGRPRAVRAVANACARNRIALLIPCHRVIRSDGGLGGYRWGLERKAALLHAEGARPAATPDAAAAPAQGAARQRAAGGGARTQRRRQP